VKLGVGAGLSIVAVDGFAAGIKQCLFQRVVLMKRPLADWSLVEFMAEARLLTAGEAIESLRRLIRIKFGIGVGLFR
jgi:hypothetical protein